MMQSAYWIKCDVCGERSRIEAHKSIAQASAAAAGWMSLTGAKQRMDLCKTCYDKLGLRRPDAAPEESEVQP